MYSGVTFDRSNFVVFSSDAWSLGAIDPTSGTAALLEITRVLGDMYRNGTVTSFYPNEFRANWRRFNRFSTTTQSDVLFLGC